MQINLSRADLFLISKALECYYEVTETAPTKQEELKQRYRNSMLEINKHILNAHGNYKPTEHFYNLDKFMEYKIHRSMQEYQD